MVVAGGFDEMYNGRLVSNRLASTELLTIQSCCETCRRDEEWRQSSSSMAMAREGETAAYGVIDSR